MFISPIALLPPLGFAETLAAMRAAAEETRLRALALLQEGELAVGELAQALGQSQPRISRHMKLLTAAGLAERAPEGAWVFYRLPPEGEARRAFVDALLGAMDGNDAVLARDRARLEDIRAARAAAAAAYFAENAANWEAIAALHLPEADIDSAILAAVGEGPFSTIIDIGCGTGRMINLFAPFAQRIEGFDLSPPMLAIARSRLMDAPRGKAQVRHGDVYDPPLPAGSGDLVILHQVLHFLPDPGRALMQAARLLKPGGRLLVVDFAPHELDFLRDSHAHRRLGFSDEEMARWLAAAGAPLIFETRLAADRPNSLVVKIWLGEQPLLEARP